MARILLTEDDDSVRAFVGRALQLDAHDVEMAEDGLEAVEVLKAHNGQFDLLLSDIKMPGMDGIQLAHAAAQDWPDLKILLMTGYADQQERAESLQLVIEDVVQKPFTLATIRSAVNTVLYRQAA